MKFVSIFALRQSGIFDKSIILGYLVTPFKLFRDVSKRVVSSAIVGSRSIELPLSSSVSVRAPIKGRFVSKALQAE